MLRKSVLFIITTLNWLSKRPMFSFVLMVGVVIFLISMLIMTLSMREFPFSRRGLFLIRTNLALYRRFKKRHGPISSLKAMIQVYQKYHAIEYGNSALFIERTSKYRSIFARGVSREIINSQF